MSRRVLILGGTREARLLADRLTHEGFDVTLSLAGRTALPAKSIARMRSGGFGGVAGLAAYLRAEKIERCIDATHPFAARISANAVAACAQTGISRIALVRDDWQPVDGDRWIFVDDVSASVRLLPALGRRIFVAFADGLSPLASLDLEFIVRRAEPGPVDLPDAEILVQRGPFARDSERELLKTLRVDAILAKASGGDSARAKLDAARNLGLPVVMLRRPAPPPEPSATDVTAILAWLA